MSRYHVVHRHLGIVVTEAELVQAAEWVEDRKGRGPELDRDRFLHLPRRRRIRVLRYMQRLLREGKYRFMVGRRVLVKRNGKVRVRFIASERDAVVLRVLAVRLRIIWPLLPASIRGGRPGSDGSESAWDLYGDVQSGALVLRGDLPAAHASLDPSYALNVLRWLKVPEAVVSLLGAFYERQSGVFEGIVEGAAPSSLLLAAVVGLEVAPFVESYGYRLYVYADDFALAGYDPGALRAALEAMEERLALVGLGVHRKGDKAAIISRDLSFLGYHIGLDHFTPEEGAADSLLDALNNEVAEAADHDDLKVKFREVIRGWLAYYGKGTDLDF